MILNIANAVIRILGKQTTEYSFLEYIWVGLGIISLVVLFRFLFNMSTSENIPVEQISRLEEKSLFGKKRFALVLQNGKKRRLGNFKTKSELIEVRELFIKIGIAN
jgi:hypothetical protein